jgi:hypothetical protein
MNNKRTYPQVSDQIRSIAPKAYVTIGDVFYGGKPGMIEVILYAYCYKNKSVMYDHAARIREVLTGRSAATVNVNKGGILIASNLYVKPNCDIVER